MKNGPKAKLELYDLAADPAEKNNLASEKPELVAKAAELMATSHAEHVDWPLSGPAPRRRAKAGQ